MLLLLLLCFLPAQQPHDNRRDYAESNDSIRGCLFGQQRRTGTQPEVVAVDMISVLRLHLLRVLPVFMCSKAVTTHVKHTLPP